MNDLYFACTDCKIIADCGYRWAYWHLLHPGVVRPRERIDVARPRGGRLLESARGI